MFNKYPTKQANRLTKYLKLKQIYIYHQYQQSYIKLSILIYILE